MGILPSLKVVLFFLIGSLFCMFLVNDSYGCEGCSIGGHRGIDRLDVLSTKSPAKGRFTLGFLFEYVNWDEISPEKAHELHHEDRHIHDKKHEEFYSILLRYGITNDLSISFQAPYVERRSVQIDEHDAVGDNEKSTGIGDSILLGNYRFYKKAFDATGIFGFKLPTGSKNERNSLGERFEPEEQPGTGSLDYYLGLALSKKVKKLTLGGSVLYQFRTEGSQDYDFGDLIRVNFTPSYPLLPELSRPNLHIVTGFEGQFANKDEVDGDAIRDTGGTTIFFAPGLYSQLTDHLITGISAPIPIYQALGGIHQEVDYSVLISMAYTW
jgi:hypothetical protein